MTGPRYEIESAREQDVFRALLARSSVGAVGTTPGRPQPTTTNRTPQQPAPPAPADAREVDVDLLKRQFGMSVYRYLYSRVPDNSICADLGEAVFSSAVRQIRRTNRAEDGWGELLVRLSRRAANRHQRGTTPAGVEPALEQPRSPAEGASSCGTSAQPTCPDPEQSRAVVVGASSRGAPLPGVEASALELAERFSHLGVPHTVALTGDEATPQATIAALKTAATQATDTLIFYFAGHGATGHRGDLYLGGTGEAAGLPEGLPYSRVSALLRGSCASRTLVILDTCASGSALPHFTDAPEAEQTPSLSPKEEYILAATGRDGWALDRDPANPGSPYTAFATALLHVLNDREDDTSLCINVPTLHRSLAHRLAQEALPKPHLFARNSSPQPFTLVFPCKSTDHFPSNNPVP
ncbi:caspase domain-containing protein [Streptomyces microflavus]|uniref:caspase family protein n=1 Tax=Streptomyces microflavus TaxID=1919 RepID=UPI00368B115D